LSCTKKTGFTTSKKFFVRGLQSNCAAYMSILQILNCLGTVVLTQCKFLCFQLENYSTYHVRFQIKTVALP
jgi:hypothetical protein